MYNKLHTRSSRGFGWIQKAALHFFVMSQAAFKPAPSKKHRVRARIEAAREGLGGRVVAFRKAKGFTQAELAEAVGLSRRMIAHYESRPSNPPAAVLMRLADVLEVGVDELLGQRLVARAESALPPKSLRFWRKLRQAEKLPESDRKRVLDLIDLLSERQKLRGK